jgi:hypothetical protein
LAETFDREHEARQIIKNPLYQEAFEELKKQLILEWGQTLPGDIETRESLYTSLRLVDRINNHFESVLESGEIDRIRDQYPHL